MLQAFPPAKVGTNVIASEEMEMRYDLQDVISALKENPMEENSSHSSMILAEVNVRSPGGDVVDKLPRWVRITVIDRMLVPEWY